MNRTAADDNVLLLVQLAALPLATPPVPFVNQVTQAQNDAKAAGRPA
jgi:hypothetical protein